MTFCFVIQPFDGSRFDKRYRDVFEPAIKEAGLVPYRVDRDPAVKIPIDEIESKIQESFACLVDISTDNPNVWFELGYAVAARKELVLVCSDERKTSFPFDVQHRSIIRYSTESSSDFNVLRKDIRQKLLARIDEGKSMALVAELTPLSRIGTLQQHHIGVLVAIAEAAIGGDGTASGSQVEHAMDRAGFTKLATSLGLDGLLEEQMISSGSDSDWNDNAFLVYSLTTKGKGWLRANQDKLVLQKPKADDDIPF